MSIRCYTLILKYHLTRFRGCAKGSTGSTFNISFTSGRDSISEVSRRGQEGPELFVNAHYFIHSISLTGGRGHDVEIRAHTRTRARVEADCTYSDHSEWIYPFSQVSFTSKLISYRLDFPRRALEVTVLSIKQPQLVEILLENIYMIDIILFVRFSMVILDAYYASVGSISKLMWLLSHISHSVC